MLALAHLACGGQDDEPPAPPATPLVVIEEVVQTEPEATVQPPDASAPQVDETGQPLGQFQFTYYWMARQKQGSIKKDVQLFTDECEPLAEVSRSFARRLALEGTGQLSDGRTINVAGVCDCEYSPCFFVLNRSKRWGVGVGKRALSPFRSVAVDPEAVPIGTMLYIPELDGLTMPGKKPWGGFVHDGCVVADDRGGKVNGKQLDFFVVKKTHYYSFERRHRLRRVNVFDGRARCQRDGDAIVPVNRNST